jgi:hypothetical protein
MPADGMLQPALFVPEKYGGFLVHSSQLLVAEARDAGIHGEGAQMYVDGDLRTADEVAHVVTSSSKVTCSSSSSTNATTSTSQCSWGAQAAVT